MKKVIILLVFLVFGTTAGAQLSLDLETGIIFTGYNELRIPGNTGTFLAVDKHLKQDFGIFVRGMTSFSWAEQKHTVSLLAAPLKINYQGTAPENISFLDSDFPQGDDLQVIYRFDSYRLTYRYNFVRKEKLLIGAGLSAKVRDASIKLVSGNMSEERLDLGLVPLINFKIQWFPGENTAITLDGDALAAPMGRAEDIALFLNHRVFRQTWLKAGYRFLEGGADNDAVYTFSLIHYAAIGALIIW